MWDHRTPWVEHTADNLRIGYGASSCRVVVVPDDQLVVNLPGGSCELFSLLIGLRCSLSQSSGWHSDRCWQSELPLHTRLTCRLCSNDRKKLTRSSCTKVKAISVGTSSKYRCSRAQMAGVFNCPMIWGHICCSMESNALLTALSRFALERSKSCSKRALEIKLIAFLAISGGILRSTDRRKVIASCLKLVDVDAGI